MFSRRISFPGFRRTADDRTRRGWKRILPPLALLLWSTQLALPLARAQEQPAAGDSQTATIEGTVIYEADADRPWRFSRYYIKNARSGELAEAVVALSARGLDRRAPESEARTAVIDQKNFQFIPETVVIRQGDSVKFTNSDGATHNVQASERFASFNVNMPSGGDFTHCFEKAGGIGQPAQIGCIYHGSMRAWVFVFEHPFFQLTGSDGRFLLKNVPPGRYQLHMSHPAGQLRWKQSIEVEAGETRRVTIRVSPDDKQ